MAIWLYWKKWLRAHLFKLNSRNLLLMTLAYFVISWALLYLANEQALVSDFSTFVYFLVVTGSTVGYGDLSPATELGRWCAILFIIPGGLSLFAAMLGKVAANAVDYWRAGILGKRRVSVSEHILLLGWNGARTMHLIRMLQHEESGKRAIVLCSRSDIENPLPGEIEFVKVTSYTDASEMRNANIDTASCIIVDNLSDDITLSAALYCASRNSGAHLLAYFKDEALGMLLKQHCPQAECIPAVGAEMLAKAAVDPGSSVLHQELLASTRGMTQYSVIYPEGYGSTDVGRLFMVMKQHYEATLIAIDKGDGIELNPDLGLSVEASNILYYIADERIESFDWSAMNKPN